MKNKNLALALTFFGGWFGAHKFYYDEVRSGVLYLLFSWTLIPGLLALIHFVKLLMMSESEFQSMFGMESASVHAKTPEKAPENMGDVLQGIKDTWKDPESRRKILKKVFFKHLS